ncbi:hypothetical protein ACUJ63_004310 [Salmonella enterica subsp. enterica]
MKHRQRITVVAGLLAGLLAGPGYSAEQVAPRFPDTALMAPVQPESEGLARQGQVTVTGRLLVSPCVLSDWAGEMQGQAWFPAGARQVTLALEGCGDGQAGTAVPREARLPVRGVWGDRSEHFSVRLKNGVNYLTFSAPLITGLVPLEMTYE